MLDRDPPAASEVDYFIWDHYRGHMIDQEPLVEKGGLYSFVGAGTTDRIQVNDTDCHGDLQREYRFEEGAGDGAQMLAAIAQGAKSCLPITTREDALRRAARVWGRMNHGKYTIGFRRNGYEPDANAGEVRSSLQEWWMSSLALRNNIVGVASVAADEFRGENPLATKQDAIRYCVTNFVEKYKPAGEPGAELDRILEDNHEEWRQARKKQKELLKFAKQQRRMERREAALEGGTVLDTASSSSESDDGTSSESDDADDDAQGGLGGGGVSGGANSHACSALNLAAASSAMTTRQELTREEKHEKLQTVMDGLKALGEHGQADTLRLKVKRAKEAHQNESMQQADNALAGQDADGFPEAGDAGAVAQGAQRKSRSVSQAYASFMQNMDRKTENLRGEAVKRAQEREDKIKFESLYKKLQERDKKIDESGSASVGAVKMEFQPHHFADMGNLRDTVLQLLKSDLVPGTVLPQKVASYCSERYRLERDKRDRKNGANDLPGFCFLLRRQLLPIEIADVRAYFAAVANLIHGRVRKMGKQERFAHLQELMQGLIQWEAKKRQEARSVLHSVVAASGSGAVASKIDSGLVSCGYSSAKPSEPIQTGAQRSLPALTDNNRQGPYTSKSKVAEQHGKGGSSKSSSSCVSKGKTDKGVRNGKGTDQRQPASSRTCSSVQQPETNPAARSGCGSSKGKASSSKSTSKCAASASAASSSRTAAAPPGQPQAPHHPHQTSSAGPRSPARRPLTEEEWEAMGL
ncbi:unnamed protein product [Amoebophrya sp. A25]|nr:unnamed protein product [Amoebophrya sp. A25]|eukprot:GSA25T00007917001.1